jgi:tyrosinase
VGCRKNVTRLTLSERQAFINALQTLKANNEYDKYVDMHQGGMSHGHGGPAFFPWHREYLRRFEDELQAIDSSVNLPYWDWTVENLNSAGTESLIWRDDLMGGPGDPGNGFAISGPFSGPEWNLRRRAFNIFQSPGGGGSIASSMSSNNYTTFRAIEGPHGGAHVWVGGNVGNAATAPQDPVFWLIHANVDRLWAEWTQQHQGSAGWVQYAPSSGGPLGHNLNDSMWPWNGTTNPFGQPPWTVVPETRRPADMLDHRAFDTFYDTVDPECRRRIPKGIIRKELQKENIKEFIKERQPKENLRKEILKENQKENIKELKEKDFSPKENKDIREIDRKPIREFDPKGIREVPDFGDVFIPQEIRPDLTDAALNLEPDVAALQAELLRRSGGLGGGFQ